MRFPERPLRCDWSASGPEGTSLLSAVPSWEGNTTRVEAEAAVLAVESVVVSSGWSQSSGGREVWRDSEFVMSRPTSGGRGRGEDGRSENW